MFGVKLATPSIFSTPRAASDAPLKAEMATGMACTRSSRRRAVTMMSLDPSVAARDASGVSAAGVGATGAAVGAAAS